MEKDVEKLKQVQKIDADTHDCMLRNLEMDVEDLQDAVMDLQREQEK